MASVLDIVQQHLGPQEMQQISQQLGTDPATTQQAVNAALPAMVGSMASTAQQPGGATGIQSLLGSHGGVLGGLGSILGGGGLGSILGGSGGTADGGGGGILGQVLGRHESTVQDGVQQASGLGSDQTRRLLMILAPIVVGALAKRAMNHGTAHSDPGQLSDVLQQDATQAHQQAKAQGHRVGGILGKILDHVESPEMRNR